MNNIDANIKKITSPWKGGFDVEISLTEFKGSKTRTGSIPRASLKLHVSEGSSDKEIGFTCFLLESTGEKKILDDVEFCEKIEEILNNNEELKESAGCNWSEFTESKL